MNFLEVTLACFSAAHKKQLPMKTKTDWAAIWKGGYDFLIIGGPYCSCRDQEGLQLDGYDGIAVRYQNKMFRITFKELENSNG